MAPTRRGLLSSGVGMGALALLALAGNPAQAAATAATAAPPGTDDQLLVHTRKEWHAKPPRFKAQVLKRRPDHIVVHHTSTPNSTDLSLAHALELSRQIQRFHMKTRGWYDIGEQLTISRGGHVMEGRNGSLKAILAGRNVMGAQTQGHNERTLGIENEGNYMKVPVPDLLWSALTEVCIWLCQTYDLNPYKAIVGHRDFNPTDCPGDVLYSRLPELRRVVAECLAGHQAPPPIASQPPLPEAVPNPDVGWTTGPPSLSELDGIGPPADRHR